MNSNLAQLIREWKSSGSLEQEGFNWSFTRNKWIETFPTDSDFLMNLPQNIDRRDVREICESNRTQSREKLLAVMVWGYGNLGYGPYRVAQMLNDKNCEAKLYDVANFCKNGDPLKAYNFLKLNRIRQLGPSYGSKFLNFCTPRSVGSPIFDSLIAIWLKKFAALEFYETSLSSEAWNLHTYSSYRTWIKQHSESFECFPDQVELVLFRDAELKFSKASQWAGK